MATIHSSVGTSGREASSPFAANMICCYTEADVRCTTSQLILTGERLLAAEALQLLMSLDRELRNARADWNQDRFRRVIKARANAVSRVRRRWQSLNPAPAFDLGKLRRRYHANLARYLYQVPEPCHY